MLTSTLGMQLKAIKDKKVRKFYETQNERLNDWLEVDTIVRTVADDVMESFDPHDDDNDGRVERGVLQQNDNDVEAFMPDDVREKRAKDSKYNWWAINVWSALALVGNARLIQDAQVNVVANIILLGAKCAAVLSTGSLSLIASLVDSVLDLLCTLIIWTTNRIVTWKLTGMSKRFPVNLISLHLDYCGEANPVIRSVVGAWSLWASSYSQS